MWFFTHVSVHASDEEPKVTDSCDSPLPSGGGRRTQDGDVMINDAGKHEVKGELSVAIP
jgi:hypothetical protein